MELSDSSRGVLFVFYGKGPQALDFTDGDSLGVALFSPYGIPSGRGGTLDPGHARFLARRKKVILSSCSVVPAGIGLSTVHNLIPISPI